MLSPAAHGVWRSLVARFVRDEEVVGSNPATPTVMMNPRRGVPWCGFFVVVMVIKGGPASPVLTVGLAPDGPMPSTALNTYVVR